MKWRKQYNEYQQEVISRVVSVDCQSADDDMTVQSFADECDINILMDRFGVTDNIPVPRRLPEYGDFTGLEDYHEAMNRLVVAREAFDELPPEIRLRFHNDPGEFLDFVHNEANRAQAVELGLVPAPPPPAPPAASEAAPPPSNSADS